MNATRELRPALHCCDPLKCSQCTASSVAAAYSRIGASLPAVVARAVACSTHAHICTRATRLCITRHTSARQSRCARHEWSSTWREARRGGTRGREYLREQYMQYRSGRAGEVYDICAHLALSCSLLRSKSANFPVTIFSSFCVSASCSHAAQDTGGVRERRNEGGPCLDGHCRCSAGKKKASSGTKMTANPRWWCEVVVTTSHAPATPAGRGGWVRLPSRAYPAAPEAPSVE